MIAILLKPVNAAMLACIVYGGWAAFANSDFGSWVSLKAFCAQGGYAFIATLFVGSAATALYSKFGETPVAVALSFVSCLFVMLAFPWLLHRLVGTPNILTAMLPGLLWGSAYLLAALWTHHRRELL